MEEHRNMVIKQELFDRFINSATALTKQIQAKQEKANEIITQEEEDFANAFIDYAKELNKTLKERYADEL